MQNEISFGIKTDEVKETFFDETLIENKNSVELHNWQREGIKYFFSNGGKAIFNCPTGVGKTFFAIELLKEILKREPELRILIVVPKNVIMETGWYQELYNNGFGLQDIGIFYGNIKEICKITITNMQSIDKIPLEIFSVIVLDEAHSYGTTKNLIWVEHDFKYKIGLSATIERTDGKHWDIIKAHNYNVFKYTPKEALKDGILNTFYYYDIGVEMDDNTKQDYDNLSQEIYMMYQMHGNYNIIMRRKDGITNALLSKLTKRKQMVNNYNRKFEVIRTICDKHKNNKIIVFSQFNDQTNKLYWELLEIGVKAVIIHSGVDKEEVDRIMMGLKKQDTFCILTTKKLDEGWNLPKLDVAIITAGDSSDRQTIQRMGRVLRKKEKASVLYQTYCLDTIEETDAIQRAKTFKELCVDYKEYVFYNNDNTFVLD